jgi:hypothetical protein
VRVLPVALAASEPLFVVAIVWFAAVDVVLVHLANLDPLRIALVVSVGHEGKEFPVHAFYVARAGERGGLSALAGLPLQHRLGIPFLESRPSCAPPCIGP